MRPTGEVGEVEAEVIGLSQGVQVSGVEFKDIGCVEGAQRSHFGGVSRRDPDEDDLLVTSLCVVIKNSWGSGRRSKFDYGCSTRPTYLKRKRCNMFDELS